MRPRPLPQDSGTPRTGTPAGPTAPPGGSSGRGPRPVATPSTARRPTGRGPIPGPPGLNRPVHRHRPAGPPGHFPLSRCRRDPERRQSHPPPGGVRGGQGVAQPGPGSQAGRRPHRRRPGQGPRDPPPAQARTRGAHGISGDSSAACNFGSNHHRGTGRWRTPALRGRSPDPRATWSCGPTAAAD